MNQDETISKLLALKRHEKPPEGYYEDFLMEFRRRQRVAAMRRNPVALWFEGLADLWPTYQVPKLAYAGIAAIAVVVALVGLNAPVGESAAVAQVGNIHSVHSIPDFSLAPQRAVDVSGAIPASARPGTASQHFVLEARPASNDLPLSF